MGRGGGRAAAGRAPVLKEDGPEWKGFKRVKVLGRRSGDVECQGWRRREEARGSKCGGNWKGGKFESRRIGEESERGKNRGGKVKDGREMRRASSNSQR